MLFPSSVWNMIIHDMEEGIVVFDRGLNPLDANGAALRLLELRSPGDFKEVRKRLIEPEYEELVLSGVEVLNAPLVWTDEKGGSVNLLASFIPILREEGKEVQGLVLLLKSEELPPKPSLENWFEQGRDYLDQVTSNLQEAVCFLDHEARIFYANKAFEDMVGSELERLIGKPMASVFKPVSRPLFLMEVIEKTMTDGSWQGEFEIQAGDKEKSLAATAIRMQIDSGGNRGIAILAHDVTEYKLMQKDMRWRNRELSLVYDLLQLTTGYHDLEETLKESLTRILSIMRAEAGAIYLRDRASGELQLIAYGGLTYRSAKELASGKEGLDLSRRVMDSPDGLILNAGSGRVVLPALEGKRGLLLSLAAVPISSRDESVGVLVVGHKQSSHFGEYDLTVLLSLASQIGVVCELAGLLEDLRDRLEELGQERDFSRALVDTMPSALALLDSRGRLDYVNRRFTELTLYKLEEIHGKPFSSLLPAGERKKTMEGILVRGKDRSLWSEIMLNTKEGEAVPVLATTTPRPFEGGEYRGVILTITDMSIQRAAEKKAVRIEEAAEALSVELAGARDSLEYMDARKQAYLSMVHHEVAAPLKMIRKSIKELDRKIERLSYEEARARLEWLETEVRRLERVSSDIRDASAAEKGRLRLRRREADLGDITSRAVEEMKMVDDKPINVEIPDKPLIGKVDAVRIGQVLASLIDNAMKFSQAGSKVRIRLRREGDRARWEVEDRGAGMGADQLQNLLDLFSGKGSAGMEVKSGLGLFICHHIIQAHRGDLELASDPGRGTLVSFTVPLE